MATIKSVLGTIKGDLGDITFRKHRDQNVVARKPASYNDANTTEQQGNRSKFSQLVAIARVCIAAIRIGFKAYTSTMSAFNKFISVNFSQFALIGQAYTPNLNEFKFSQGPGQQLIMTGIDADATNDTVDVNWDNTLTDPNAAGTDDVTVILYNTVSEQWKVVTAAAQLADGTVTVALPMEVGETIGAWAFVTHASNGTVGDSSYDQANATA